MMAPDVGRDFYLPVTDAGLRLASGTVTNSQILEAYLTIHTV